MPRRPPPPPRRAAPPRAGPRLDPVSTTVLRTTPTPRGHGHQMTSRNAVGEGMARNPRGGTGLRGSLSSSSRRRSSASSSASGKRSRKAAASSRASTLRVKPRSLNLRCSFLRVAADGAAIEGGAGRREGEEFGGKGELGFEGNGGIIMAATSWASRYCGYLLGPYGGYDLDPVKRSKMV
jgi:hypothetical protein